ncbi:MAG: hypothetical protein K2G86_03215 [Prevotella sp.]|nr:hypothetical protein [Prevotella sp.]
MKIKMKKVAKIFMAMIVFVTIPAVAGLGIMALWNSLVTSICGFAAITFWQSIGFFLLGQLLSGGFLIMLFVLLGMIHSINHHHGDWHDHWHKMSDEERREFIFRRRKRFQNQ